MNGYEHPVGIDPAVTRQIIQAYESRLVCSWCGEDYEGDPEFSASYCCSCDLVPADGLTAIIQDARRENEELLAAWVAEDEARV